MDIDGVDPASRPVSCCPTDMMDCQATEDSEVELLMAMLLSYLARTSQAFKSLWKTTNLSFLSAIGCRPHTVHAVHKDGIMQVWLH